MLNSDKYAWNRDVKSHSRLFVTAFLLTLLFVGAFGTRAHAFMNGQSASLVIGQNDFTSSSVRSSPSSLYGPTIAVFDSSGNLWVGDSHHSRVIEFKPPFSTGMDASLVIGQPDFKSSKQVTSKWFLVWCGRTRL